MFLIQSLSQDDVFRLLSLGCLCSFLLLWEISILLATALDLDPNFYLPLFKGKFTPYFEPLISRSDPGSRVIMH